ncbi:CrcB family protein [uncultured Microbacterium sp.]|uniref:fluoride efflux transporter FluC n=1 Tax=uncultured Microbacterium sp. TaxID=191216 RepID=UPI0025DD9699|nr:CrcB family protein [uncultured Microbacterium sp.]
MSETEPLASLPLDPDVDEERLPQTRRVPVYVRPTALAVVFLGGSAGAAAREGITLLFPAAGGMPWAVFAINVSGAFLLGALLETLARRGPDEGRRRLLRLLLGTGVLGGYTTYSSFATDTAGLLAHGAALTGVVYALATVLLGAAATGAGIALAAAVHRRRSGVRS